MDKNAIKSFAIESRRKMIESVKYQASLIGITANGIVEPISKGEGMETYDYGAGTYTIYDEDIKKRESLVREVKNKGFNNVVEEVAYTWFNRIIAIRYMEVNDYLPTRTRVLSSEDEGKTEPDIVTEALDIDLDYSEEDRQRILKFRADNEDDKLFQLLFIKQCNKLNEILPGLFEKTDDYMELLLDIKFTNREGVISNLINNIPENYFCYQVEIIGWIYQYYISEKKDEIINIYKGNIKKEDIPAATQLFTTDWIVKYMVDNSLGRYWIERNHSTRLDESLEFYLGESNEINDIDSEFDKYDGVSIENLKFLDPCMGSGHILVYAFDVFFKIYKELGYQENEIPELIIKNNLFGLDIDDRAYQLAYFAMMMKARKYDRKIFEKEISPNVYSIQEPERISNEVIDYIEEKNPILSNDITYLKETFKSGKEFGSLIKVKNLDYDFMKNELNNIILTSNNTFTDMLMSDVIVNNIFPLISQSEILSKKYDIVVTNPPYMNKLEKTFKDFARKNYADYSKDLFSMFIFRNFDFCKEQGYCGFMTPFVWMFIKNYEKLREYIINNKSISSLIQLEYSAFSEATVPICTFVLLNKSINREGIYLKLSDFKGGMDVQRDKVLEIIKSPEKFYNINQFFKSQQNFIKIPGMPIAYWVSEEFIKIFDFPKIEKYSEILTGMSTGKNSIYLRYWYEVDFEKISINQSDMNQLDINRKYWIPYNKGGERKNWYGNNEYIVNWKEKENFNRARKTFEHLYLRRGLTWSFVTSGKFSMRFFPEGYLWDVSGSPAFFDDDEMMFYSLGFLCTDIANDILKFLNPTINIQADDLKKIPLVYDKSYSSEIISLVKENISISVDDWNEKETSWDFKTHPFIKFSDNKSLKNSYDNFKDYKNSNFQLLKNNEILLNNYFSKIYSLPIVDELDDEEITLSIPNYEKDVKSFISYIVGCIFGRYGFNRDGIISAGNDFNLNDYSNFYPDDDNIIPVLDTAYFNDDIVGRFAEFIKICYGEENLEENLDFIASALKKKGKTSREIIRNYFLNDFFKDHAQTYKKCPIYWQFDSGKQNAFKCLVYMHRYEPGLVARVRTDYLHKTQKAIEDNLAHCEDTIASSSNKSEVSKATKDRIKYLKQLDEIRIYDEALGHIANQQIVIDLDDGVKVNYAKFQNVEISKEGEKTKKINLLKKI